MKRLTSRITWSVTDEPLHRPHSISHDRIMRKLCEAYKQKYDAVSEIKSSTGMNIKGQQRKTRMCRKVSETAKNNPSSCPPQQV